MITIIGVRFREVGKIYYFDPRDMIMKIGDKVIVDTSRGLEFGTVVIANRQIPEEKLTTPLKEVIRIATAEDREQVANNRLREYDALRICRSKVVEHKLDMKVISAEYTFDHSKLIFYFTSDGRVDFRELVKSLSSIFKTRIELRQVGVRDETKIVGGIGSCGRALCCHSYLSDFVPVSIKMAKEQNLSLNPQKISGVCGRLMCCLKNEVETYEYLNSTMPKVGDFVELKNGVRGSVASVSILRQKFKVLVTKEGDEKELVEYEIKDIRNTSKRKKGQQFADELPITSEQNSMDTKKKIKKQSGKNK